MPKFKIEQVALFPPNPKKAIDFLKKIGMAHWIHDTVKAVGYVHSQPGENEANLAFNYDALDHARELEVLHYNSGPNWMQRGNGAGSRVSHIGMHVTADELIEWQKFMAYEGIKVAQEVHTEDHSNPNIAGKRFYNYVIFDTYDLLSVDLKFIVRRDVTQETVGAALGSGGPAPSDYRAEVRVQQELPAQPTLRQH